MKLGGDYWLEFISQSVISELAATRQTEIPMTTVRKNLVDTSVTRWYHCISRCVRAAFLMSDDGDGFDRKQWIENRLKLLAENFAVAVGGFAWLLSSFAG